jgi:ketosteroid isomerase-like protein
MEVARQGYDAVNRADWPALMDLLDPAIEWRVSTRFARAERTYEGHDGVREIFALLQENFVDMRAETQDFIDADPWVIVPLTLLARARGSNEPITFELVMASLFRNGRAARMQAYATAEEALDAVRSGTLSTNSDAGTGRPK